MNKINFLIFLKMPRIHKCVVIVDYYYFFHVILVNLLKRSHISPISYVSVFYYICVPLLINLFTE